MAASPKVPGRPLPWQREFVPMVPCSVGADGTGGGMRSSFGTRVGSIHSCPGARAANRNKLGVHCGDRGAPLIGSGAPWRRLQRGTQVPPRTLKIAGITPGGSSSQNSNINNNVKKY
uniref:Uncharacterized protein n=1 Tax=Branchiostoma floridae TaxID=7739 RepID=C3YC01_BRAFL|eukprot:XP_002606166.1 hypothetical protein BRAFLDRAFT_92033 [Branchiostoma floridae]